jgi:hypothetical protein
MEAKGFSCNGKSINGRRRKGGDPQQLALTSKRGGSDGSSIRSSPCYCDEEVKVLTSCKYCAPFVAESFHHIKTGLGSYNSEGIGFVIYLVFSESCYVNGLPYTGIHIESNGPLAMTSNVDETLWYACRINVRENTH